MPCQTLKRRQDSPGLCFVVARSPENDPKYALTKQL